ncbi:hypothetical protein BJX62DRAFT_222091 [Aspergillus germanicus]
MSPLSSLRATLTQIYPPKPTFTEAQIPPGLQRRRLGKILYAADATVYITSRPKDKVEAAIKAIKSTATNPTTSGTLKFLHLDLNDSTSRESKLDILWNNAGTGANGVRPGQRTAQGFEPMIGFYCIATLLFTQVLVPLLRAAAADTSSVPGATRVVWTSSGVLNEPMVNYGASKAGTWFQSRAFARRYKADGIPVFAAYTELFMGLSTDVKVEDTGAYVIPWGRIREDKATPRHDLIRAGRALEERGLGYGEKLWEWCEEQWGCMCRDAHG